MSRRNTILTIASTLPLVAASVPSIAKSAKPNVIMFLVDDMGKEWVEAYGGEDVKMPNLCALTKESILFERAYSMPQSTPSRAALMTGQYPYNSGWINHYDVPRWGHGASFDVNHNPSIAREIRNNGYKTCTAGKWQLNDFRLEPDAMQKVGFDSYCMWTGTEGGNEDISDSRFWDPYIHTKEGSKQYKGQFGPDIYSNFIIDFINENHNEPMFIYYPMALIHSPLVHTPHRMDAKTSYERYSAMIEYTDYIIGNILKTLKDNKIDDNTYIIFATDNGSANPYTGCRDGVYVPGGKALLSENGVNAPLIVHAPNGRTGVDKTTLIDFTDFYPTFLELTGSKDRSGYKIDGKSFAASLKKGSKAKGKDYALSMGCLPAKLENNRVKSVYDFRDRVIIGKKYKIYLTRSREIDRVYDICADHYEQKNLVDNVEVMKEVNKELGAVIAALPEKDASPKYTPLKHNAEFDIDPSKLVSNKFDAPNWKPLTNEASYTKFKTGRK